MEWVRRAAENGDPSAIQYLRFLAQDSADQYLAEVSAEYAVYREYRKSVDAAGHRYLTQIADLLAEADEIEVSLLTKEVDTSPMGRNDFRDRISECRTLTSPDLEPWLVALASTLRAPAPNSLNGHYPIHAIRVLKRVPEKENLPEKEVLYEATLCWRCQNFRVLRIEQEFGFPDKTLEELCNRLLPIPERQPAR